MTLLIGSGRSGRIQLKVLWNIFARERYVVLVSGRAGVGGISQVEGEGVGRRCPGD